MIADANKENPEITALWDRYLQNRGVLLRNQIVCKLLPLVDQAVRRLRIYNKAEFATDDLKGYGYCGLIKFVEEYNPKGFDNIYSLLVTKIRWFIVDQVKSHSKFAWNDVQRRNAINSARTELENEFGRLPSDQELAERMGISERTLKGYKLSERRSKWLSLDRPIGEKEDVPFCNYNIINNRNMTQLGQLIRNESKQRLRDEMYAGLSVAEQAIICLKYQENQTDDDISFRFALPKQDVETVHKMALRKIAENLGADVGEKDEVRRASLRALREDRKRFAQRKPELNPDRPKNDPTTYDGEFRLRCVQSIMAGEALMSVANRTGVGRNALRDWEKRYQLHGRCGLSYTAVRNSRDSYDQETRQNCILAVIKGMSFAEASRTFGVARSTVHRWMKLHKKGSLKAAPIVDNSKTGT